MTAEWPPTGLTLREWSDYLLAQYPLEEPEEPAPGGLAAEEPEDPSAIHTAAALEEPQPGTLSFTPIDPPPGYDPATDPLKPMIDVALPMLSSWTCRNFVTGEDIPDEMEQLATLAVTLTVETLVYGTTAEARTAAMTSAAGNLRSISAGPWSESYFAPGEVKYAWNVIVSDPLLNSMLLALITPECLLNRQAAASGTFPPGYATQEIDWAWPPGYGVGGLVRGGDWLP